MSNILLLSSSNFFNVYTKLSLKAFATCKHLNVRYPNEEYTSIQHDFQQIQDVFNEEFYQKGLSRSPLPFSYNAYLAGRIERFLKIETPSMIFIELQEVGTSEFKLLKCVSDFFEGPIAVFVQKEDKTAKKINQFLSLGVKEIIESYDAKSFQDAYHRHVKSH